MSLAVPAGYEGSIALACGEVHWGDSSDLYAQEWGWFGVGLYAEAQPNLWNSQQ